MMVSHGKFAADAQQGPVVGENRLTVCNLGDVVPWPTLDAATSVTVPEAISLVQVHAGENQVALELN
jgi:hypothetical protein